MVSVGTTLLCPCSQKGATDIMLMNMHGCVPGEKMYKTGGMVEDYKETKGKFEATLEGPSKLFPQSLWGPRK